MAPGTLFQDRESPGDITVFRYQKSGVIEERSVSIDSLTPETAANTYTWIRVTGIHDAALLQAVGEIYGIHQLTQEDIQNIDRRPSFSALDDGLFLTVKKLEAENKFPSINIESVCIILKGRTIITFHEAERKGFPGIRESLRTSEHLRSLGADYIAYRIWDECVDSWLTIAESMERHVMDLEERILFRYGDSLAENIHETRKLMAWLRWEFRPYRDLPLWMSRYATSYFSKEILPFIQDLTDHALRISDLLDLYRDLSGDLMSILMSVQSNRMNAVMKVLTVIATLFMPLSFIAGIYGMNFEHMPELAWRWGYPAVLGIMGLTAGGMALYFKVKKWL